jgi:hypothetical protein
MLFGVMPAGFVRVVASMCRVAMGHVRVVTALLVTAIIVMFGCFAMVASGVLMMLCRFGMMVSALMLHGLPPKGYVGASAVSQFDDASTTGILMRPKVDAARPVGGILRRPQLIATAIYSR